MPIFGQKNVHSLKNTVLSCHFFQISIRNPCCHAHIWSEKCKFCHNYIILYAKKVNRMPFFPIFAKNHCCHPHILTKNVHSRKKTALMPIFSQKTSNFQKQGGLILLKKNHEKPNAVMPIFGKITSILSKLHNVMGQKS